MTNLTQNVTQLTDLNRLKQLVHGILGEVCWRINLSYGDELNLHIGAKIPYVRKAMIGQEKGSWILGSRETPWNLSFQSDTVVTSNTPSEVLREKVRVIENTTVIGFEVAYPSLALAITFSNDHQLVVSPNLEDCDLPYWELFTPDHMLLKVGPGAIWSCVRSDVAEN